MIDWRQNEWSSELNNPLQSLCRSSTRLTQNEETTRTVMWPPRRLRLLHCITDRKWVGPTERRLSTEVEVSKNSLNGKLLSGATGQHNHHCNFYSQHDNGFEDTSEPKLHIILVSYAIRNPQAKSILARTVWFWGHAHCSTIKLPICGLHREGWLYRDSLVSAWRKPMTCSVEPVYRTNAR